jgi:hypothetical protein
VVQKVLQNGSYGSYGSYDSYDSYNSYNSYRSYGRWQIWQPGSYGSITSIMKQAALISRQQCQLSSYASMAALHFLLLTCK